ncbi:MAG: radical SAM family heme chaperone HemW [Gammaproteobacteria bacterium]|nr:radical SAM family heme chaperone HemW [Gammaproteobacteria bacterium]
MSAPNPADIPLSLYIHIPWCVRKCPYCDFNSHEGQVDEKAYVAALLADLDQDLALTGERPIHSIFFGGGTPSLFSPKAIGTILDGVQSRMPFEEDCEITLEANPGTVEQSRFEGYRAAGVNRLSIGIQSFNSAKLKSLGRIHNADEAVRAADAARNAGFDNFNLDLMFALPGQSEEEAIEDMEQAIALGPSHISHYHLTMEPNTVFAKYPPQNLPNEDDAWDMQDRCHNELRSGGYENYEVSAWSQPGKACRHNLNYWRFGDYLGIGAGAHGKLTQADGNILRTAKKKAPTHFMRDAGSAAVYASKEHIADKDLLFEYMLNRLRLASPFNATEVTRYSGLDMTTLTEPLNAAADQCLLTQQGNDWRRTEKGAIYLNELLELFLNPTA